MTEQEIQKKVLNHLKREEWMAIKTIMLNKAGMPDIIAFKDGVTIFLEVKKPGGKLTPLQKNRLETLREKGFIAKVIYDPFDLTYILLNIMIKDLQGRYLVRIAQLICEEERIDSDWKVQVLRLFAYGKVEEAMKVVKKKTKQLNM